MEFIAKFNQAYFNKINIYLFFHINTLQLTAFRQHIVSSEMRFEALIFIFIDVACERKSE